jgi:hypothetical protein
MSSINRFGDNFSVESNQRISREDNSLGVNPRHRRSFAASVEQSQFTQGQVAIEPFLDVWRDGLEFESGPGQQFKPPR